MIGSLLYVRVSGFDFLSVLKGEADVVLCADRGVVHQPVPAVEGEFTLSFRLSVPEYLTIDTTF